MSSKMRQIVCRAKRIGLLVAVLVGAHAPAAMAQTVDVIEYYNASLDHYFIGSLPVEINALDAGLFLGWTRTGLTFRAYPRRFGSASPVCRFYIPPGYGDSHFYSASSAECAIAQAKYPLFILESPSVMYIDLPDTTTGACPPGDVSVYRMWDARVDTNHRYTTIPGVRAQMVARGWVAEGYGPNQVIMCAPGGGGKVSTAQIVFAAPVPNTANSVQEIFTMNLDGSMRTQITHDGTNKFLPHFSPDGTRLVYTQFLVGGYGAPDARTDVAVYDFASGTETLPTHTETSFQPVWSPDGKRIAFGTLAGDSLWIMNSDGSNAHVIGSPSGALDDLRWADFAWSNDDWILFVAAQNTNNCFKTRLDKIRPDGTARTQVTDGGPHCTPNGMEQSGDADPGFSADGKTVYSSRGFPRAPVGMPGQTERRLYSFSSDAWTAGKAETDLSLPSAPDCIEGVPKGSPDGTRVLLFRACAAEPHVGVTLTDTAGSYRLWITDGFGPDWNPVAK